MVGRKKMEGREWWELGMMGRKEIEGVDGGKEGDEKEGMVVGNEMGCWERGRWKRGDSGRTGK